MKKYFAKWFICSDGIKVGGYVFLNNKNYAEQYVKCENAAQAKMWTKLGLSSARLELCEREIVADTFVVYKNSDKPYLVTKINPSALLIHKGNADNFAVNIVDYYPHIPLRLGVISNKATWVKAYDEFRQKEIRLDKKGVVKILCPTCKTFH